MFSHNDRQLEEFIHVVKELTTRLEENIMTSIAEVQAKVEAQAAQVTAVLQAIHDLEAKIQDLEAQLAAAGGGSTPPPDTTVLSTEDQASLDAMGVAVDAQSANLQAGAAAAEATLNPAPAPAGASSVREGENMSEPEQEPTPETSTESTPEAAPDAAESETPEETPEEPASEEPAAEPVEEAAQ